MNEPCRGRHVFSANGGHQPVTEVRRRHAVPVAGTAIRPHSGCYAGTGLIELAQFALAFSGNLEEPPAQFDSFFFRPCFQNREAANEFLRLSEETIRYSHLG